MLWFARVDAVVVVVAVSAGHPVIRTGHSEGLESVWAGQRVNTDCRHSSCGLPTVLAACVWGSALLPEKCCSKQAGPSLKYRAVWRSPTSRHRSQWSRPWGGSYRSLVHSQCTPTLQRSHKTQQHLSGCFIYITCSSPKDLPGTGRTFMLNPLLEHAHGHLNPSSPVGKHTFHVDVDRHRHSWDSPLL